MKCFKYFGLLICVLFSIAGCKQDEPVTGSLLFQLNKGNSIIVPLNSTFVDPGCVVKYYGKDYSKEVTVSGTVDPKTVGLYPLTYTFTNPDGVKVSKSRDVIVADPNVKINIAGTYITAEGTYRLRKGAKTPFPGFTVRIDQIGPGFFSVSDLIGGYYDQRAGYGPAYASSGYVQVTNEGTIKLLSSNMTNFGEKVDSTTFQPYNSENGTIEFDSSFVGMTFHIILNKQ